MKDKRTLQLEGILLPYAAAYAARDDLPVDERARAHNRYNELRLEYKERTGHEYVYLPIQQPTERTP